MTIDEEKFWGEISEGWRKEIEKIKEEEEDAVLLPDEITIKMLKEKTGLTLNQMAKWLDHKVDKKEATMRRAKINGHWTKIYRLVT